MKIWICGKYYVATIKVSIANLSISLCITLSEFFFTKQELRCFPTGKWVNSSYPEWLNFPFPIISCQGCRFESAEHPCMECGQWNSLLRLCHAAKSAASSLAMQIYRVKRYDYRGGKMVRWFRVEFSETFERSGRMGPRECLYCRQGMHFRFGLGLDPRKTCPCNYSLPGGGGWKRRVNDDAPPRRRMNRAEGKRILY